MNYRNEEMERAIDSFIHNKVHRDILKRRLIDGICFEPLAEEFGYSVRQIKRIVYKAEDKLFKNIRP